MTNRAHYNACRFRAESGHGHYESWFQRANHPTRPLAFWIRYTIFSPRGAPHHTIGELWSVFFDGERDEIIARKREVPIANCAFSTTGLQVQIEDAILEAQQLKGAIDDVSWDLRFSGHEDPLLLLPAKFYDRSFPKAKALVGTPHACYKGKIVVGDTQYDIDNWVGSQNHNWGSKHTDRYAWGQVCGFDDDPNAFLECGTGRIKLGPIWTPWITMIVVRIAGVEYAINGLLRGARTQARFGYFHWDFDAQRRGLRIRGHFEAPNRAFAALRYYNPPGGWKTCLNSKLARCELVIERDNQEIHNLHTQHRAAFEILTDDEDHGLEIRV